MVVSEQHTIYRDKLMQGRRRKVLRNENNGDHGVAEEQENGQHHIQIPLKPVAAQRSDTRHVSRKQRQEQRRQRQQQQQQPPPLHGAFRVIPEAGTGDNLDDDDDEEGIEYNVSFEQTESTSYQTQHQAQPYQDPPLYAVEAEPVEEVEPPEIWEAENVVIDDEAKRRRKRRCIFGWSLMVTLLAVSVAIAVAVVMSNRGQTLMKSTDAPSQSPTFSSNAGFTEFLTSISPDDGSAFQNPDSPQSKALDWILNPEFNVGLSASMKFIQRYVLAVFYYSTNGDNWQNNDGWLTSTSVCEWFTSGSRRTLCNNDGILLEIDLNRNGLQGSIPSELSMLRDYLSVFLVNLNQLMGTLPSELGLLTNLEVLLLESNQLSGTIPSELGQLTALNQLYVDANDFTGVMPGEVCVLRNDTLNLLWGDCAEIDCPCCVRCCTDGIPCNTQ